MYSNFLVFFSFFSLIFSPLMGEGTIISGKATEYAGTTLVLYTYQELITFSEKEIARTTPAADGIFSMKFSLSSTQLVFFHLGKNKIYLFAEPGVSYQVIFPPKSELTKGDLLNPYFREDEIMLGIQNADTSSLNAVIARFDEVYGPLFATYAQDFYNRENYKKVDSTIAVLRKQFGWCKLPYFRHYLDYKTGMLRSTAWQFKARSISDPYFNRQMVQYMDPVYMELFHSVFDKYFQKVSRSGYGAGIYDVITNKKSYFKLDSLLKTDSILVNDTLRALVILKNIRDEFYAGAYSRTILLTLLDSMISKNPIPDLRNTAQIVRNKVVLLLPGFEPPQFELLDRNGKLVKLPDFRGKYVYLGFCNCFSYSCLKEFEMLDKLQQKHKDRFVIITISADSDLGKMQDFLAQNEYNWIFLNYGNQVEVLKDYDIRTFPTYYIIGPDGKLLLSPAPGPGEQFESYMFQLMRSRGDL